MTIDNYVGVAISTTGDEHRIPLLIESVRAWNKALPAIGYLCVTVDGDEATAQRVHDEVGHMGAVHRVGQPTTPGRTVRDGRLGVAVNKNTGIEALMGVGVEHLFLSDDDTWPLFTASLTKHIELRHTLPHSMVNWGRHRRIRVHQASEGSGRAYCEWNWPRGAALYAHHTVIATVGGMLERFGPGGHEHVEWSRRIHQAGITPVPFGSPASYDTRLAMGSRALWHAEDMARPGEPLGNLRARRKRLTSVRREDGDWEHIERIMHEADGDTTFVDYRAEANSREPATLY